MPLCGSARRSELISCVDLPDHVLSITSTSSSRPYIEGALSHAWQEGVALDPQVPDGEAVSLLLLEGQCARGRRFCTVAGGSCVMH